MTQMLSKVEDHFELTNRGLVIIPGIPGSSNSYKIEVGDSVELKRPDGSMLIAKIGGLEMVTSKVGFIPILLGGNLGKQDVPLGTEVWFTPETS